MAHLDADRILQLIRKRFYLPKMDEKARYFINNQRPCVKQKKPYIQGKPPLLPITSSAPLEIVGIDLLHLKKSSVGFAYILLITDHFIRCTQAYPTRNKTTKTSATHLYNDFALRFGISSQLLHG